MYKAIVTGATGFIGVNLIKKLVVNNCYVYAIVRPNSKNIIKISKMPNLKIIECDLRNVKTLNQLINERCDCFFHLGWNGTRVPERDDCIIQNENYINSICAYESALQLGCNCFISTGSQAEYGKMGGEVSDDYLPNPTTEYGKWKLNTFNKICSLAMSNKIKFGWISIFSCYGPGDYENSLISTCMNKMKRNESINLTTGEQMWNYIYVDDVVNILYELMINDGYKCNSFNVCSEDSRPLKEFVYEMKEILNSKSQLLFGSKSYNKSEGLISFKPKCANVKSILDYNKFVSFHDGIRKMVDWSKENI